MLFELFVVGSFWFWGLIGAAIIWELISTANELWRLTLAGLLVFLSILQFGTNLNPWSSVAQNPSWVGVGVLGYLALGIVWMIWKWRCFVFEEIEKCKGYNRQVQINVDGHKSDLMGWAAFWPFSLLAYIFSDLTQNIYEGIYRHMRNWLQSMADRLVSKYGYNKDKND